MWAYEIGYMLTGSHFLLAMAFTLREGQHIRIDIFSEKFSQRTARLWNSMNGRMKLRRFSKSGHWGSPSP